MLSRIHARVWGPGDLIPSEADLATEFGCARATVNRALRAIADAGLLDRRRKAGSRVATHPVRKATLHIPVIRKEIEARKQTYDYSLLARRTNRPPADIRARLQLPATQKALHVTSLHRADDQPYVIEDRWINTAALSEIEQVDFSLQSANEWLVMHAPFTKGDIAFSATNATPQQAKILATQSGQALFVIERSTWNRSVAITAVRLIYHPGYRMQTQL